MKIVAANRHRVLVCILAAWALLVIAPDFYRVFKDYGTLGFSANNNGRIYEVFGPPAIDAGLRVGDRLDLKAMRCGTGDDKLCRNALSIFGGMGGLQYVAMHRPVTIQVQPARTVVLDPALDEKSASSRFVLLLDEIAGVAFILLAAALVWQRPNLMTWGFFVYAMWFNPGQYFVAYVTLQRWPDLMLAQEAAQSIAQAVGYAGFVVFALRFPNNVTEPRWIRVERSLPFVIFLLAMLQLASFGSAFGYQTETITRIAYFAGWLVDAFVIFALFQRRKVLPPEEYQRVRWVLWGCGIGLTAFIIADSNEATTLWHDYVWGPFFNGWSPPESVLDLFYLANALLVVAVFHAVRKHRIVNVSFHLRRGTAALLVSLPCLVLIEYFHYHIEESLAGLNFEAWAYIALAVIMSLTIGRVYESIVKVLDRTFNRAFELAKHNLLSTGAKMLKAANLDGIDTLLADEPKKELALTSAAVFRQDGKHFRSRIDGSKLDADHPLVKACLTCDKTIRLQDCDASWRENIPSGDKAPAVVLPVTNRIQTFAIAFYGPHTAGDDLDTLERDTLRSLADDAAAAYDHVRAEILEREVHSLRDRLRRLLMRMRKPTPLSP